MTGLEADAVRRDRGVAAGLAADERYFRLRGWIPMPLYALALGAAAFARTQASAWELGLGLAVVCAGVALRSWARVHIGRGSDTRRLHARRLVRGGPYAWTRNPLYLGNVAIASGLAWMIGLGAWTVPFAGALLLHYHRVALAEEGLLARSFGAEYEEFRASVPRWGRLPRPSLSAQALSELRREGRIAALALGAAAAVLALRVYAAAG